MKGYPTPNDTTELVREMILQKKSLNEITERCLVSLSTVSRQKKIMVEEGLIEIEDCDKICYNKATHCQAVALEFDRQTEKMRRSFKTIKKEKRVPKVGTYVMHKKRWIFVMEGQARDTYQKYQGEMPGMLRRQYIRG